MGTPGVPFNKTEQDIVDALKRHKGVLKRVAEEFDCSRTTITLHIQDYPKAVELMNELRHGYDNLVLNMAEDNVVALLEACDPTTTFFTLNTRGEKRGWIPKGSSSNSSEEKASLQAFSLGMKEGRRALQEEQQANHNDSQTAAEPAQANPDKSQ